MIEKVSRIEGRKTQKYSFEHEGKELNYEIQEPVFEQLTTALSQVQPNGSFDVVGSGKVIWELFCVAHDKEITDRMLVTICVKLADEYTLPLEIDIKKK